MSVFSKEKTRRIHIENPNDTEIQDIIDTYNVHTIVADDLVIIKNRYVGLLCIYNNLLPQV